MRNRIPALPSPLGRAVVALLVLTAAGTPAPAAAGSSEIAAAPAAAPAPASAAAPAPTPPPPLEAIVRGFFIGARLGGGYMVMRDVIPDQPADPPALEALEGLDEGYGPGSMLQVEIGYDLGSLVAVEAVAGVSVVAGTRTEWVRDLGLAYGGLALRLSPGLTDRLRLAVAAGGGYAVADNAVEPQQKGPAAFGSVGLEYYVHVRHFSLGLDVSVVAPISPLRVFVAVGPQLKYTF